VTVTVPSAETIAEQIERYKVENARLRASLLMAAAGNVPCFDHQRVGYKVKKTTFLGESLPECGCRYYEDIFTVRRWNAQGYLVRKGETACTTSGAREQFKLFCRCQVDSLWPTAAPVSPDAPLPGFEEAAA
jgi:hypothetical protein